MKPSILGVYYFVSAVGDLKRHLRAGATSCDEMQLPVEGMHRQRNAKAFDSQSFVLGFCPTSGAVDVPC